MGEIRGPEQIIKSGIRLVLDVADRNSYPTTGTTWFDMSGNNITGSLLNGPTYNSDNGGSLVFDGTNDYINMGASSLLMGNNLQTLTIMTWFRANTNNPGRIVSIKSADGTAMISIYSNSYTGLNTVSGSLGAFLRNNANTLRPYYSVGKSYINNWTHVALVINNLNIYFYVNGTPQLYSNGGLASLSNLTNIATIGAFSTDAGSASTLFSGNIANVSFYRTALNRSQISDIFDRQKSRFGIQVVSENSELYTTGLLVNLDAGVTSSYPTSGTTWSDISGNNNNGTLVNGPTFSSSDGGGIVLDGSNDYVNLTNTSNLNITTGDFTIDVYTFYERSSNQNARLASRGQFNSAGWNLILGTDNTNDFCRFQYNPSSWTTIQPGLIFSNNYYHIVVARTSGVLNMYINGILLSTTNVTFDFNSTSETRIGASANNVEYYKGRIFSYRQYNVGLTTEQVRQNYLYNFKRINIP